MSKFEDIRGITFDLDGTLVDSAPGLAAAVDMALYALELPVAGEERVITRLVTARCADGACIGLGASGTCNLRKTMGKPPVDDDVRQKNRYVFCVNCSIATIARLPKRGTFCSRTLPIRWARRRLKACR